jgi:hypothetical protein
MLFHKHYQLCYLFGRIPGFVPYISEIIVYIKAYVDITSRSNSYDTIFSSGWLTVEDNHIVAFKVLPSLT